MIEYKDKLTIYDEVNFHQKLLNSTINFTENGLKELIKIYKKQNLVFLITQFYYESNVDLKNTNNSTNLIKKCLVISNFKLEKMLEMT